MLFLYLRNCRHVNEKVFWCTWGLAFALLVYLNILLDTLQTFEGMLNIGIWLFYGVLNILRQSKRMEKLLYVLMHGVILSVLFRILEFYNINIM